MAIVYFTGYHGTSFQNSKKILSENSFINSVGDHHWMGDGSYFFIKGKSQKPSSDANNWAITEAYNKRLTEDRYTRYAVLEAGIQVDEDFLLDLSSDNGQEIFNYLKDKFIQKVKKERLVFKNYEYLDGMILNVSRLEGFLEVDVVKGDFYIKFTQERIFNINFRTPNVTMCAVYSPTKCIREGNLKVVKIGTI